MQAILNTKKAVSFAFTGDQRIVDKDQDDPPPPSSYTDVLTLPMPTESVGPLYLNCSGQELEFEDVTALIGVGFAPDGSAIEALDLRKTTLAVGTNGPALFDYILLKMPYLKRLYIDDAAWIESIWKDFFGVASEEAVAKYIPLFCKVVFPLASRHGKEVSFQELLHWANHIYLPPEMKKLAFSCFFFHFPQVEKIDCRDPVRGSKIQDEDLELLLGAIPVPYGQTIALDLSNCSALTTNALEILGNHKAKLIHVNLLRNPWVKESSPQQFAKVKEIVGLQRRITEALTYRQLVLWLEMYPKTAGAMSAVQALFEAHPEISILKFGSSSIDKDLLGLVINQAKKKYKSIDLSENPQLAVEVLLLLQGATQLESLNLTGNQWIEQIWSLEPATFAKVEPLIAKLVYPLKSPHAATLEEIYQWRDFLRANRMKFSSLCQLFFKRFPTVIELNLSSYRTNIQDLEAILSAWPCGKNQNNWSGKIDLTSPVGVGEEVFKVVKRNALYLLELYVDETLSFFSSPLIHRLEPTYGETLVPNLALQDGPKEGRATYAMIKHWSWLVGKFVQNRSPGVALLFKTTTWLLEGYAIDYLDFSDSLVTHQELCDILYSYQSSDPKKTFSLSLIGCSNLSTDSFSLVHQFCVDQGQCRLTSLAITEGSALANGIDAVHMNFFWKILVFSLRYPAEQGKFTYSDLCRWHALMGEAAEWKESCIRFFQRFPDLKEFDFEGKSVDSTRLSTLFSTWQGNLKAKERMISIDISGAELTNEIASMLPRFLTNWIERIDLSRSKRATDETLATLLSLRKLKKIEIEKCPNISDEMIGFCEPLLAPPPVFRTKESRLISVSYHELFPFLQKNDAGQQLTSYFLHHPRIEKMEFGAFDLDQKQFDLIAKSWKAASDLWKGKVWSKSIPDDKQDWSDRAPTLSLHIGQCQNLTRNCFTDIRDCFEEIVFLDLAENQWVGNTGLEILEERRKPLTVQVYGCQNITSDIENRLSNVTLIQPHWHTPVADEGIITFSQIRHHASEPLSPVEQVRCVLAFLKSMQEDVWPKLSPLLSKLEEATFAPTFADWQKRITYLLPYQRDALSSLIGKEIGTIRSDEEVRNAYKAVAGKILPDLTLMTEMSTKVHAGEKSHASSEKKGVVKANVETLISNLGGQKTRAYFLQIEGVVEASFFLLDLLKAEEVLPLRKTIEKQALAAYIALFPSQNWELEPPFVHRAAVTLGFPTLLPDPTSKGEGAHPFLTLAAWMEKENFSASLGQRARLIDYWLTTWTSKVELLLDQSEVEDTKKVPAWPEEWAFWTKGYGGTASEASLITEACTKVRGEILSRVREQREFLYGFSLSDNVMRSFPSATKIDLKKGKITPWQLEGVIKSIANKEIELLDLSYNPFLSAEELMHAMLSFKPKKMGEVRLDGNAWVNNRLVKELEPYAKVISVERCVGYTPVKEGISAAVQEEFVRVDKTAGFRMSDEQTSPQAEHITKIRSLLSPSESLEGQYWDTIVGQLNVFTNISCGDSDIRDNELEALLKALGKALEAYPYATLELDLSDCPNLTPDCFKAFAYLGGKLSSLKLSRNQWVGAKGLLEGFTPHAAGLRHLDFEGCYNLSLEEIDLFVSTFFDKRNKETPGKTLSLTIEKAKFRDYRLPISLVKGEKYSDKLHSAIIAQTK